MDSYIHKVGLNEAKDLQVTFATCIQKTDEFTSIEAHIEDLNAQLWVTVNECLEEPHSEGVKEYVDTLVEAADYYLRNHYEQ